MTSFSNAARAFSFGTTTPSVITPSMSSAKPQTRAPSGRGNSSAPSMGRALGLCTVNDVVTVAKAPPTRASTCQAATETGVSSARTSTVRTTGGAGMSGGGTGSCAQPDTANNSDKQQTQVLIFHSFH